MPAVLVGRTFVDRQIERIGRRSSADAGRERVGKGLRQRVRHAAVQLQATVLGARLQRVVVDISEVLKQREPAEPWIDDDEPAVHLLHVDVARDDGILAARSDVIGLDEYPAGELMREPSGELDRVRNPEGGIHPVDELATGAEL